MCGLASSVVGDLVPCENVRPQLRVYNDIRCDQRSVRLRAAPRHCELSLPVSHRLISMTCDGRAVVIGQFCRTVCIRAEVKTASSATLRIKKQMPHFVRPFGRTIGDKHGVEENG